MKIYDQSSEPQEVRYTKTKHEFATLGFFKTLAGKLGKAGKPEKERLMKHSILITAIAAAAILISAPVSMAKVPSLISYQGQLTDSSGTPLDTTVDMTFAIYNESTNGVSIWSETQPSVEVTGGVFQVLLGSVSALDDTVFNDEERWLGVTIGVGPELEPRTRIVSGAYAQRVATVDGSSGGDITGKTRIVDDEGDVVVTFRQGPTSGAGQVFTLDPNRQYNTLLGTSAGNPDHGGIAAYDESGSQKAILWIPSHGSGMIATKGPNDSFNVRLSVLAGYPNNGYVAVRDSLDVNKVGIYVSPYGNGRIYTMGPNGSQNLGMGNWSGNQNNGFFAVFNENDSLAAGLWAGDAGRGIVSAWGPKASSNVHLTSLNDHPENGHVGVYDSTSWCQGALYIDSSNNGIVFTRGPNGNRNVRLMYLEGYPDHGYVSVWDASDTIRAGIYVDSAGDGVIFADVKNFRVDNPDDRNTEIWYASLEGPEAGAYIRGTGHLVDGHATIEFEKHFANVASPQGMTVQITPLSADSKGLAVIDKNQSGFAVAELNGGKGSYDFDFTVMAVRKGHEDYRVIRPASESRAVEAEQEPAQIEQGSIIDRDSAMEEELDMDIDPVEEGRAIR
jgi:hypothetical protein